MADRPAPATEAAADAERMRRVQAGDEAAFAELMHRWERPVKAVIGRIVLNARDAEDLAQETFVRVWQNRGRFRAGAEFRPWVFSIATNLARNRLRWWRSRPEIALGDWDRLDALEPSGRQAAEGAERARAVRDAIARLPVEQREALVLFEYEQMSQAEIAEVVGATPKAVENRVARARERLRSSLARWL